MCLIVMIRIMMIYLNDMELIILILLQFSFSLPSLNINERYGREVPC